MSDPTAADPLDTGVLRCPHHGRGIGESARDEDALHLEGRSLGCAAGHRFDLAAQGYVNLSTRPAPVAADTADMVLSRVEVQEAGLHAELTTALAAAVEDATAAAATSARLLVDLGAGTGHHLAGVLDALPPTGGPSGAEAGQAGSAPPLGLAIDISKYAARRAARAHPRIGAVVADVWGPLPLADGCADVVLTVFAPRNRIEVARILRPGGHLVVVTPDPEHLQPLVDRLGLLQVGDDKLDRLDAELDGVATRVGRTVVRTTHHLDHRLVRAVATMGPSAHHLDAVELDRRIGALPDPVEVTQSVVVSTYRRTGS